MAASSSRRLPVQADQGRRPGPADPRLAGTRRPTAAAESNSASAPQISSTASPALPSSRMPAAADPMQEQYQRDGYIVVDRPLVSQELLARAVAGMEAVRAGSYDTGRACAGEPLDDAKALAAARGAGNSTDELCKMELPQLANFALREVVSLESIGQVAAKATGAEWVQVWWTQLLGKPAGGNLDSVNVGWHQDRNYWQGSWCNTRDSPESCDSVHSDL